MTVVLLDSGRVINGVIIAQTQQTLTLQMPTEQIVIAREEIEQLQESELSIMPERQLEVLSSNEVRDLIGYLMSPHQIPLAPIRDGR